jgi:hypothetical protein
VTINLSGEFGPHLDQTASPTEVKDEYVATFPVNLPGIYSIYVVANDDADVATTLSPVQVRIAGQPHVTLQYVDGQYSRDFEQGAVFSSSTPLVLLGQVSHFPSMRSAAIVKVEVYANDQLICANVKDSQDNSPLQDFRAVKCPWSPRTGRYKLVAVGTDAEGEIGRSTPVEIVIQ